MAVSKFLQATIARNGPLLDAAQVAALRGMSLEELDKEANAANDDEHADFVVQLQIWNKEMERYIIIALEGAISPCIREFAAQQLKIECRELPVGARSSMPQPRSPRHQSVQEVMKAFFPRPS